MRQQTDDETENDNILKTLASEYNMAEQYVALLNQEQQISKFISKLVKEHPMWDRFFESVDGCGPLMAAMLVLSGVMLV